MDLVNNSTIQKQDYINVILGFNTPDFFDTNLPVKQQQEIVKSLIDSKEYINIIHSQNKFYYFENMRYIITGNTIEHQCESNIITKQYTTDNLLIQYLTQTKLSIDHFPGTNEYQKILIVEQTKLKYQDYDILIYNILSDCVPVNDNISSEIHINIPLSSSTIDIQKIFPKWLKNFGYQTTPLEGQTPIKQFSLI